MSKDTQCNHCTDCGSRALHDINGEFTCTRCGLVAVVDTIDYSTPQFGGSETDNGQFFGESHHCVYLRRAISNATVSASAASSLSSSSSSSANAFVTMSTKTNNSVSPDVYKLIETACETMGFPECVRKTAVALFRDYTDGNTIMGGHRTCCVFACIFHSQGVMNGGQRSKTDFVNYIVNEGINAQSQSFMRACTELHTYVTTTPSWRNSICKDNRQMQLADTIGRIMSKELYVPEKSRVPVRKVANKIYDKVKGSPGLVGIMEQNVHTACVYLACKYLKIEIDAIKCMSETTTNKLVNIILSIIVVK